MQYQKLRGYDSQFLTCKTWSAVANSFVDSGCGLQVYETFSDDT